MPQVLTKPLLAPIEPPANRKRWTRAECDFLERSGLLTERYELMDGEIVLKVGQNRPRAIAVTLLIKWLIAVFGGDFVQCQMPIEIAEEDRSTNRPEEVSDTTLRDDLQTKARLYARAGIPEYWVLDVPSRRLIVHLAPTAEGYSRSLAYTDDEPVAAQAAPDRPVPVADLLPPPGDA